jgi:hypothetical protein
MTVLGNGLKECFEKVFVFVCALCTCVDVFVFVMHKKCVLKS